MTPAISGYLPARRAEIGVQGQTPPHASSFQEQVAESEQREELRPVLGEAAVAGLQVAELSHEQPEGMFAPGAQQGKLIQMLRAEGGATIEEIVVATGWQSHTVRGAMSGALKKRLGLEVTSEKIEARGRVYRLPPA